MKFTNIFLFCVMGNYLYASDTILHGIAEATEAAIESAVAKRVAALVVHGATTAYQTVRERFSTTSVLPKYVHLPAELSGLMDSNNSAIKQQLEDLLVKMNKFQAEYPDEFQNALHYHKQTLLLKRIQEITTSMAESVPFDVPASTVDYFNKAVLQGHDICMPAQVISGLMQKVSIETTSQHVMNSIVHDMKLLKDYLTYFHAHHPKGFIEIFNIISDATRDQTTFGALWQQFEKLIESRQRLVLEGQSFPSDMSDFVVVDDPNAVMLLSDSIIEHECVREHQE